MLVVFGQILCNDCLAHSLVPYHFAFHRCSSCQSFNTDVVTKGPAETLERITTDQEQKQDGDNNNNNPSSSSSSDSSAAAAAAPSSTEASILHTATALANAYAVVEDNSALPVDSEAMIYMNEYSIGDSDEDEDEDCKSTQYIAVPVVIVLYFDC